MSKLHLVKEPCGRCFRRLGGQSSNSYHTLFYNGWILISGEWYVGRIYFYICNLPYSFLQGLFFFFSYPCDEEEPGQQAEAMPVCDLTVPCGELLEVRDMAYRFGWASVQIPFGTDDTVFHDEDAFFAAEYGFQGHFISIIGFHCVSFVQIRERHEAKGNVPLLRQGVKCLQFLPILRFQFFPCRNDGQWPASRQVDQRIRHFFVLPVEDGEVGMPIEVCSPVVRQKVQHGGLS